MSHRAWSDEITIDRPSYSDSDGEARALERVNAFLSAAGDGAPLQVLECPPPARARWSCTLAGEPVPAISTPEEAVEWGRDRVGIVLIRSLAGLNYFSGSAHDAQEFSGSDTLRPWPPSEAEWVKIESAYREAFIAGRREQTARAGYRSKRDLWLIANAPQLAGRDGAHRCLLAGAGRGEAPHRARGARPDRLDLRSSTAEQPRCRVRHAKEAIAAASGRTTHDPWVLATSKALEHERNWLWTGRRHVLEVHEASGELNHVSPAANRDSIRQYGLDWRRMGDARGVAGSVHPELAVVFLGEDAHDIEFFTRMARQPCDAWGVAPDGLWVENGPNGWLLYPEPIPASRLRFLARDLELSEGCTVSGSGCAGEVSQ